MARASSEPTALSTKTVARKLLVISTSFVSRNFATRYPTPPLFPKRGCNSLKTKGRSRKKSAKRLQATEIVRLRHALRENGFRLRKFSLIFAFYSPIIRLVEETGNG